MGFPETYPPWVALFLFGRIGKTFTKLRPGDAPTHGTQIPSAMLCAVFETRGGGLFLEKFYSPTCPAFPRGTF